MKGGVQSVTANIFQITGPLPDVTSSAFVSENMRISADMVNFWMQLASIAYATEEIFLGSAVLSENGRLNTPAKGVPKI